MKDFYTVSELAQRKNDMMQPRFYSIKEVAKALSLSKSAIYNEIAKGRLEALKCKHLDRTIVSQASINEYINKYFEPYECKVGFEGPKHNPTTPAS